MTAAAVSGLAESPRLVPVVALPRDRLLPRIIAASLLLHVLVLLPLLKRDKVEPSEVEIPVELVPPPKTAEQPAPKPAPKPPEPEDKARQKPPEPQPKPQEKAKPPEKAVAKPRAKPVVAKPAAPKPRAKPAAPKPASRRETAKAAKPPQAPVAARTPAAPPQPSTADRLKALLGAMPAIALPGASGNGSDAVSYSQLVLSKLAKAKKQGRYRGIPGNAGVAFSIGDNGEIVRVELVAPSGDPSLDEEAVAMIKRGAPYPPPPPGGRRDYAITLRFSAISGG